MIEKNTKLIKLRIIDSSNVDIKDFNFGGKDLPLFKNEAINQYYKESWRIYSSLPFPKKQDEPWRRTSLALLEPGKLKIAPSISRKTEAFKFLDKTNKVGKRYSGEIEITETGIKKVVSEEISNSGLIFTDFRTALDKYPEIALRLLGKIVPAKDGKFSALTSAYSEDGIFLYVPKNTRVELPFHASISNVFPSSAFFSHVLVWIDDGAEASLFLEYSGDGKNQADQSFHGGLVEVLVGVNSDFNFYELQSFDSQVWSIMHERAKVSMDGRLNWVSGTFGSHLTKNFTDIDLIGKGGQARLSGLYISDNDQHMDHDTQQNHLAADTTSDLLYKGVVKGKGRSVWQGMIFVSPDAMKTDGYQTNKNLLLSKDAQANSIPGLEILANDVRCSHGATVSNIDKDELFYLETRGINQVDAEGLIVRGFLNEVVERIPSKIVQERFDSKVDEKMK